MIDWCEDNLEVIRLEKMQEVKTSYVQYAALGIIGIWALFSVVSLLLATWRWCTAIRDTKYKFTVVFLYLISLALVSKVIFITTVFYFQLAAAVWLKWMTYIYIHALMGALLLANLSQIWTVNAVVNICGDEL